MQIFQTLKKNLRLLGILYFESNHQRFWNANRINFLQHFLILSIQTFYFLSTISFFMFEAKTFDEYIDGFLFVSSSTLHLTLYSVLTWQKAKINKLIISLDALVQRSKLITKKKEILILFFN